MPNRAFDSERRDRPALMRPPKRQEAPACRTGPSILNDASAAAEAPGGAGVPNRAFDSERRAAAEAPEAPACRTGPSTLNDATASH